MPVRKRLSETISVLLRTVFTGAFIAHSLYGVGNIGAECPEAEIESDKNVSSSKVIRALEMDELPVLVSGPTYKIYDAGVKQYGVLTALVQSSNKPISLGAEMRPYIDTQRFWTFVQSNGIEPLGDAPQEIYVYNWLEKAQGKMIFDVGIPVSDNEVDRTLPNWLEIKSYKPMKVASLVYVGPFPHQDGSGWKEIRWEDRAEDKGCVYDERMYRELYHRYDFSKNQHIAEIQISVI